jgi:hypothetical protein
MTDTFRALCAELANYLQGRKDLECGWGEEDPEQDLLDRARAALAQPEPQGPSRPAIEPVPVSERLPGPEDCDAEGRCWMCGKVKGDWRLISTDNPGVPQLKYAFSHWLPHWALPVHGVEGEP